jgi:hypothetical protein
VKGKAPATVKMSGLVLPGPRRECVDEAQELDFLYTTVFCNLVTLGYADYFNLRGDRGRGHADMVATRGETVFLVLEGKRTSKMPFLGRRACDIVAAYRRFATTKNESIGPTDRVIAQQLARLFRHMHDNEVPCGVLTSGTVTVFVRRVDDRVEVSDAWLVDQSGYIQAWAWFMQYAHNELLARGGSVHWGDSSAELAAKDTYTSGSPGRRRGASPSGLAPPERDGRRARGSGDQQPRDEAPDRQLGLLSLEVLPKDTRNATVLGYGRHGCIRLVAVPGAKVGPVALKEFDGDSSTAAFCHELSVARKLARFMGTLVPRLLLVAHGPSWSGVRYLGFQPGRPLPDDFSKWTQEQLAGRKEVLRALQDAGFVHTDADAGRNFVLLTDSNGVERVAAVDFESICEAVKPKQPSKRRRWRAT